MLMHSSPFLHVATKSAQTSQGPVELPIAYQDNSNLLTLFSVEPDALRKQLGGLALEPVLVRGMAQVGLVFFEYKASSIGPYNEVGLAALVTRRGTRAASSALLELMRDPHKRSVGAYVLHLPVTTAAANAAGRELWGYPKFVTEIDIHWEPPSFSGAVHDPERGGVMLALSGTPGVGLPLPAPGVLTYSRRGDEDLDTVVDVRGHCRLSRPGSLRLLVSGSAHPMAQTARELGLDGARPQLAIRTMHSQSLLHAGVPVARPSPASISTPAPAARA